MRIAEIFASYRKSGSRNTKVTSDFSPEVEIRPFRACAMNPAIIIYWNSSFIIDVAMGRYHVPQNAFLVLTMEPFSFTFHVSKILWQTLIGELLSRDRKQDQVCVCVK